MAEKNDYIKREDAINKITIELSEVDIYSLPKDGIIIGLTNDLKNIPSADVVERKRGEWKNEVIRPLFGKETKKTCSNCKQIIYDNGRCNNLSKGDWNYCPNCGADMRGAECQSDK